MSRTKPCDLEARRFLLKCGPDHITQRRFMMTPTHPTLSPKIPRPRTNIPILATVLSTHEPPQKRTGTLARGCNTRFGRCAETRFG